MTTTNVRLTRHRAQVAGTDPLADAAMALTQMSLRLPPSVGEAKA